MAVVIILIKNSMKKGLIITAIIRDRCQWECSDATRLFFGIRPGKHALQDGLTGGWRGEIAITIPTPILNLITVSMIIPISITITITFMTNIQTIHVCDCEGELCNKDFASAGDGGGDDQSVMVRHLHYLHHLCYLCRHLCHLCSLQNHHT